MAVNKKMKTLVRIFYEILLKIKLADGQKEKINKSILSNYLDPQHKDKKLLIDDLANYFEIFYDFCFELKSNNMLKGQINFKY